MVPDSPSGAPAPAAPGPGEDAGRRADDAALVNKAKDATVMLRAAAQGGALEGNALLELLYDELHQLAGGYLARERPDHTLQPTALVHEAYLKLIDGSSVDWNDRQHFFATAARAMRNLLVDHARGKKRAKRGGGWKRVEIDPAITNEDDEAIDLVELDRALDKLREHSERQARIVELRYFAGLSVDQVADVTGLSERTVARDWRFARAWLFKELSSD